MKDSRTKFTDKVMTFSGIKIIIYEYQLFFFIIILAHNDIVCKLK